MIPSTCCRQVNSTSSARVRAAAAGTQQGTSTAQHRVADTRQLVVVVVVDIVVGWQDR